VFNFQPISIKIRLEIKSQNYGCWSLLAVSNLGNGKSYNSVAIFQKLILVVGPIHKKQEAQGYQNGVVCFLIISSETTWTIETKLPRNDHWKVLYKIYVFYVDRKSKMAALIILVVSEKKAFEHFLIGSNVNLCPAVAAILDFRSA
jgi:hypothetical protein